MSEDILHVRRYGDNHQNLWNQEWRLWKLKWRIWISVPGEYWTCGVPIQLYIYQPSAEDKTSSLLESQLQQEVTSELWEVIHHMNSLFMLHHYRCRLKSVFWLCRSRWYNFRCCPRCFLILIEPLAICCFHNCLKIFAMVNYYLLTNFLKGNKFSISQIYLRLRQPGHAQTTRVAPSPKCFSWPF